MSHAQNDIYNEQIEEAEQDLRDAEQEHENALKDLKEASLWLNKMELKVEQERARLKELKNKDE